jgi:hypothetical protein
MRRAMRTTQGVGDHARLPGSTDPSATTQAAGEAIDDRRRRVRSPRRQGAPSGALVLTVTVLAAGLALVPQAAHAAPSAYDTLIRSHNPAMYLTMSSPARGVEKDLTGRGHVGTYHPAGNRPSTTVLPNGDRVADFNGAQYLQVADASDLSVTSRGRLTIEAWIRPDRLEFRFDQGSGYVHVLGKGVRNQHEYVMRMYSKTNSENRPNRISGYAFNLAGGLGSGSYFQDPVRVRKWILVTIVINTHHTSTTYPTGYVKIFKNGLLRDTTRLDQFEVVPGNGTAPFRVGTRDFGSFFEGAVGKVAVYLRELPPERISSHYKAMTVTAADADPT